MQQSIPVAYAAYWDNEIRMSSSSGGIFSILAEHILSFGGVVYGVALTADCKGAEFIRVNDVSELYRLRGSKYLQAKMGDVFKSVRNDLEQGISVLFSGTGCQVNGLKGFLKKGYDNLVCVDVICHGTPSPALWRKYVDEKQQELGGKIVKADFRSKDKGWENYGMKFTNNSNVNLYIPMKDNVYMKIFLKDYPLRPSCFECVAKSLKMSDLTIADFWGIGNVAPDMNDGKGTSLVLVRTQTGATLFNSVSNKLKTKQVTYDEGVRSNPSEYKSVSRPKSRDAFFKDMNSMSINALAKKYCKDSISITFKRIIKRLLFKIPFLKKSLNR